MHSYEPAASEGRTPRSPVVFVGHGSPMLAITDNPYRAAWQALGAHLPRPRAILCVSAHWETHTPMVCTAPQPETIHDFGGFPSALYAMTYPAPGAPDLARRVLELAPAGQVSGTDAWGLDHGAWCVLSAMWPQADLPVCQLSLARTYTPQQHLELAQALRPLRDENVLVLCSGNVVHNLRHLGDGPSPSWALEVDAHVENAVRERQDEALLACLQPSHASAQAAAHGSLGGARALLGGLSAQALRLAIPTPEHYLPVLYAAGLRSPDEGVEFFVEGFDLGSLSMRSWVTTSS